MENVNWSRAQILNGTYVGRGLRSEKSVQTIAVEDIAVFVALAFENPKQFLGKTIELVGDDETEAETAATFAKVIGRPEVLEKPIPGAGRGARPGEEMKAMFNFFNGEGYDADIPALRKIHPGLLTLEQWLRKNGWENAQPVPEQEQGTRR